MSVTLQERRERAESRIESLLGEMDPMVRMVYESLLTHGADHHELNEKQQVARLEGFHDYIIVREETGVEHPGLEEYIETKKRLGDELISFSTGKHRMPIEGEGPAPVLADEPDEAPAAEEEEVSAEEVIPAVEVSSEPPATVEAPAVEAPAEKPVRSIFAEDDEEVVIESENEEEETGGFVARVPESKPEPDFSELLEADREVREEEASAIVEADGNDGAPRISASDVVDKDFSMKMGGYDQDEVDDFLDETAAFMRASHSPAAWLEHASFLPSKDFTKKGPFKKGYAPAEVTEYLKALQVELEIRASEA